MRHNIAAFAGISLALACVALPVTAGAMSLKDCSVKYQAAKKDGSLGTKTWAEYRHSDCGDAGAGTAPVAASVAATTAPAAASAKPAASSTPAVASVAAPVDLPAVIDPKFASEKPARARLHTCAQSYRAHKKAGTLNGLKWLQKGGGFYSLCNRKLKAAG